MRLWILWKNETRKERLSAETSNPAYHPVEIRLGRTGERISPSAISQCGFRARVTESNRLEKQTGKLNFSGEGKHPRDSFLASSTRRNIPSIHTIHVPSRVSYAIPDLFKSDSLSLFGGATIHWNGFVGTFRAAPFVAISHEKLRNLYLTLWRRPTPS